MSFLVLKNSRILISVILLIAFISGFSSTTSIYALENTQDMSFECESAILMEAKTGTVLYSYNPNKPLPPASVTKIMTLLLVMEEIDKGNLSYTDTVTTSAYAASMGGSQIFLKEGEQMTVEDMIKSVAKEKGARIALFGHTHVPFCEEMDGVLVANPGSLSLPRQADGRPTYMILWLDDNGQITWEQCKVEE